MLQEASTNTQSAELTQKGHSNPSHPQDKTVVGITNPVWLLQAATLSPLAIPLQFGGKTW